MASVVQFALLGIGLGTIYALLGQGIVLIYRGSGVLNLAHGGFATVAAFVFIRLHSPQAFGVITASGGWPLLPAMAVAIATAMVLGVLTDLLIMRRLAHASPLARLIATLALLLVIQAAAIKIWGSNPPFVPSILPSTLLHLGGGIVLNSSYLWLLGIAIGLTVILTVIWRYTRVGWVTAAVSHSQRSASAVGVSPAVVSTWTWAAGAGLAGLAGILITPITQVTVSALSLTVIAALAAVLLGGFESFPATLACGLLVGMAQSVMSNYQSFFTAHLNLTQASDALPLLVIVVVLAVRGSSLPMRGHVFDRLPALGTGRIRWPVVITATAVVIVVSFLVAGGSLLFALMTTFAVSVILLSFVVLTGYAGQLSLAQYTVAGLGGLISARLSASAGFPFLAAAVVGVIGAMIAGLVFAIPALRTRGVNLAVVTLAFAWAAEDMVFSNPGVSGETAGIDVGRPTLFGWSIAPGSYPARYTVVTGLVFVGCAVAVANLRRSRLGRQMIAVRSNERAAAAAGVGIFRTKMVAFAIAGALAGIGGVLIAYQYENTVFTGFDPFTSLLAVSEAVIGGVGLVMGTVAGAVVAPGALLSLIGLRWVGFTNWLPLIGGAGALFAIVFNQNGVVWENLRAIHQIEDRFSRRRRPAAPATSETAAGPPGQPAPQRRVPPKRLQIHDLTVRYGGVVAVDGISIDVDPGEVVGLIGPNGAGKTSLMDAVSGFVPYAGTVSLDGEPVDRWPAHKRTAGGMVRSFQGLELFGEMTVLENLQVAQDRGGAWDMGLELVRPRRTVLSPMTQSVVQEFGLIPFLDRIPDELSYGQRRLVAIGRAAAAEPSVLLLDEPVSGLSSTESAEFFHLVRRLADVWGMAVLVIEHDMDFVMTLCDRLVVIDFGRYVCDGTPAQVRDDPAAIAAYLGTEAAEQGPGTVTTK